MKNDIKPTLREMIEESRQKGVKSKNGVQIKVVRKELYDLEAISKAFLAYIKYDLEKKGIKWKETTKP